jgi:energy-coupling factor transporter ATP-binding protein EcfA2
VFGKLDFGLVIAPSFKVDGPLFDFSLYCTMTDNKMNKSINSMRDRKVKFVFNDRHRDTCDDAADLWVSDDFEELCFDKISRRSSLSRRRDKGPSCSGDKFKVFDYDASFNSDLRNKILKNGNVSVVSRFRGLTLVPSCDVVLPFPVYVDERSVVRACNRYISLSGNLPRISDCDKPHFKEFIFVLLNPNLRKQSLACFTSDFVFGFGLYFLLFLVSDSLGNSFMYFNIYLLVMTVVDSLIPVFLTPQVVLCSEVIKLGVVLPICEEFLKLVVGGCEFGLFEFLARLQSPDFSFIAFLPFMLHICISFLPFKYALLVHILWNVSVLSGSFTEHCLGATLGIESLQGEIAFDLDLVKSLLELDYVGIVLKMLNFDTFHPGRLRNLCSILTFGEASEFCAETVKAYIGEDSGLEEEIVCLGPGDYRPSLVEKFCSRFLPKSITASLMYKRIVAFVLAIVASRWFTNIRELSFFNYVPEEGKDIIATAVDLAISFYSSVSAVMSSGNWMDFFTAPKDVKFEDFVCEFEDRDLSEPDFDIDSAILEAEKELEGRRLEFNSPTVEKLKARLLYAIRKMKQLKRAQEDRCVPYFMLLLGTPGGGKTSLVNSLAGVVARVHDEVRFNGDIVPLNINLKHPAEAPHLETARIALLNDVKADHKNNKTPGQWTLEEYIQQIVDSNTLVFPSATPEGKSHVYNNLNMMVVSTNAKTFLFSDPCERLERRVASGMIVEMEVYLNDKIVPYSVYKNWPLALRNSRTRFQLMKGVASDCHFKFEATGVFLSYAEYFVYFERSLREHVEKAKRDAFAFGRKNVCPCGVSIPYHLVPYSVGDEIHPCNVDKVAGPEAVSYCEISEVCNPPSLDTISFAIRRRRVMTSGALNTLDFFSRTKYLISGFFLFLASFTLSSTTVLLLVSAALCFSLGLVSDNLGLLLGEARFMRHTLEGVRLVFGENFYYYKLQAIYKYYSLKEFVKRNSVVISIFATGAMGFVLYNLYKKRSKLVTTGNVHVVEKSNVDPRSLDVGVVTRQSSFSPELSRDWGPGEHYQSKLVSKGVAKEDLVRLCRKNSYFVKFFFPTGFMMETHIFLLDSMRFVFNYHYLKPIDYKGNFDIELEGKRYSFDASDWKLAKGSEMCVCRHNFNLCVTDVKRFLLKEDVTYGVEVTLVYKDQLKESVATFMPTLPLDGVIVSAYQFKAVVAKGDCSLPLIGKLTGGFAIVGFQAYGMSSISNPNCLDIAGASAFLASSIDVSDEEQPELVIPLIGNLKPASVHHCLARSNDASLILLGDSGEKCSKFKSKISKSLVHDVFSPLLKKQYTWPGRLSRVVEEGGMKKYYSAIQNTLCVNFKGCMLRQSIVRLAALEYLNGLPLDGIQVSPLSLEDAILGLEDSSIGRLPFNTSCGPYYAKDGIRNKHDLFEEIDGKFVAKPFLKEDICDILKKMDNDELYYLPVKLVPKDEVKSLEKIGKCDVRYFGVIHLPPNLVVRMYLMPLVSILLSMAVYSECYGSMNAGSIEWNNLANRLFVPNSKLIDMDFKKYDRSHMLVVLRAVAWFFKRMALTVGYTELEAKRTYYSVLQICWHLVFYQSDVFIEIGHMSSGFLLTLIMNSLINSFLMRCAFQELTARPLREFRKLVRVATVGDDNASSVSDEIADVFNVVTIAKIYEKYGYHVTNADKSAELKPFVSREDIVFLKRHFVFSSETNTYLAPLEKDSIYKALCFDKADSKSDSPISRLVDIANSCQREFFLHGKKEFLEFQELLRETKDAKGIPFRLLDYDSLMVEYWEKRFRTFAA